MPAFARSVAHSVLVVCWVSKSAIFTVKPSWANSRAKRRAKVDFPAPPFWETMPVM